MTRATPILLSISLVACVSEESGGVDPETPPPALGVIDLEIGDAMGVDERLFSRISGVAVGADGRIYVADGETHDIRVFDRAGAFAHRIGRRGEGPGELDGPCCPGFSPDGLLWVRDVGNARYNAYRPGPDAAEFVGTLPIRHPAAGLGAATTFDPDGRLIDVGVPLERAPTEAIARFHRDADGGVGRVTEIAVPAGDEIGMHSVERRTPNGPIMWFLYQPFGPRHLVAHGPGGRWAEAVSSAYRVTLHVDGDTLVIARPSVAGPELTAAERERGEAAMAADRERLDLGPRDLPYGLPDRKPPLRDLYFGSDGRLWVELNAEGNRRVADLYDGAGVLVARREWPEHVAVGWSGWAGASSLVGVSRDSLGVNRLVRVVFDRP